MCDYSNNTILSYAIENGIINVGVIQDEIEMKERRKYLEMHNFKKWQDKDGWWNTYLPDAEKGRVRKRRKTEKELDNIIIIYWRNQEENPTIREVFDEWNDRKLELQKISPATHIRNRQCFNRHFSEIENRRIRNFESDDCIDFLEEQIPKYQLSAKAFSNLKGITKGFLKRAKKRKIIDWSVEDAFNDLDVSDVDFKKNIKEDYEEVFNEEETAKMIRYLIDNQDVKNIGILLMFVTGIRVGELVALKHEVFEDKYFKIRRTETRYLGEDGKHVYEVKEYPKSEAGVRDVVIPSDYVWLLNKIRLINPFGEYIFVDSKGKRMTTNCFRRRLTTICDKLDIYRKSPHKIRKTYGTILLDNNVDRRLVEGQMGHADIITTETRYHRNRRSIENKQEVLSAIPDFAIV